MKEHMKLLGLKVCDRVTGFTGIVTSISFELYGCVQAVITPPAKMDTEKPDGMVGRGHWFDTKRLEVLSTQPVMELPTFEVLPGGASLPRSRNS